MKANTITTDKSQNLGKKAGEVVNIIIAIAGGAFCVIGIYMQFAHNFM